MPSILFSIVFNDCLFDIITILIEKMSVKSSLMIQDKNLWKVKNKANLKESILHSLI